MRIINQDKLVGDINTMIKIMLIEQSCYPLKIRKKDIEMLELLRDMVSKEPTLSPDSLVKRGRWIKSDMRNGRMDFKCSVCQSKCYVPTCMGKPMYEYCPHCGAKMIEEEEIDV